MLAVVLLRASPDAAAADAPAHAFEEGCKEATAAAAANPLLHTAAVKFVPASELSYTIGLRDGLTQDRSGLFDGTGPLAEGQEGDDEGRAWASWWWEGGGRHGKPRTMASM